MRDRLGVVDEVEEHDLVGLVGETLLAEEGDLLGRVVVPGTEVHDLGRRPAAEHLAEEGGEGLLALDAPAEGERVAEDRDPATTVARALVLDVAQAVGVDLHVDSHEPGVGPRAVHVADLGVRRFQLEQLRIARHLDVVEDVARQVEAETDLGERKEDRGRDQGRRESAQDRTGPHHPSAIRGRTRCPAPARSLRAQCRFAMRRRFR